MRVFLVAIFAMIVIGAGAAFALSVAQKSAGVAYSTDGARIHPKWSWRQSIKTSVEKIRPAKTVNAGLNPGAMGMDDDDSAAADNACSQAGALRWLYVDFGDSTDESGCKI